MVMKNIYVIPTDKPSRLFYYNNHLGLARNFVKKNDGVKPQHIYITSDEEIKEGDWFLPISGIGWKLNIPIKADKYGGHNNHHCKKIILTTDQDLDSVQSIDDEFLQWFVKNPSCESVGVTRNYLGSKCLKCGFIENHDEVDTEDCPKCHNTTYEHLYENKIIIPQEEPKQEKLTYTEAVKKEERIFNSIMMKQETLEEAADKFSKELSQVVAFYEGAKWQQERMYSKEDLRTAWMAAKNSSDFNEWFEQFKKK
jgi:ssDNA-binding Zn-finger/Zn-ribbon topoisomerase 1